MEIVAAQYIIGVIVKFLLEIVSTVAIGLILALAVVIIILIIQDARKKVEPKQRGFF